MSEPSSEVSSEFWVDRPDGTALVGRSQTVATYRVGDGVRIDGDLVATDLWAWLDSLAGQTWIGYLGYGVKAITRGGTMHPGATDAIHPGATDAVHPGATDAVHPGATDDSPPDALWMRADQIREVAAPPAPVMAAQPWPGGERSSRERADYLNDIGVIKGHLARGESYEVCLTRTVEVEADPDPFDLFLRMRAASPTGRSVYLRHGNLAICSATPEEFLTVGTDGLVSSSPIKGTAARHPDPRADRAAADALIQDPKTRAENLMIVDLVRNDLHQVCEPGSVQVPRFLAVESYAAVHQLVSTVVGRLSPGRSRVDAIRAAFPPGSMTGAPKERTTAIIDALEPRPRGIYSGAIGVLGADGSADLRVVIRTAVVTEGRVSIGTGGAIVWASDPEAEWDETVLKADGVLRALAASRPSRGESGAGPGVRPAGAASGTTAQPRS